MTNGIDISGWQAGFNVSTADTDFVFIKATGGGSFTSSEFTVQTASAEASGKPHGFYHYASEKGCAADPITEANHFLSTIAGHVGPSTGIALDWEETNLGNTGWVYQWLEHVRAALGRDPSTIFLYMSQATVNAYDWSAVINAGYRLWCAQYPTMAVQGYGPVTGPPAVRWGNQGITIWQYSSAGRIAGWGGNLDLNVLYTDWDAIHGGATGQANSITPIQEAPDLDADQNAALGSVFQHVNQAPGAGLLASQGDINQVLAKLADIAAAIPNAVLNTPIPVAGKAGKTTTLATEASWNAANFAGVPAAVWNQNIGTGNAAGVVNHIDQKPAAAPAAVAQVDVEALAAKLATTLPPAVVAQLAAQLAKL